MRNCNIYLLNLEFKYYTFSAKHVVESFNGKEILLNILEYIQVIQNTDTDVQEYIQVIQIQTF